MNPILENIRAATRRHFLKQTFAGIGGLASTGEPGSGRVDSGSPRSEEPHFCEGETGDLSSPDGLAAESGYVRLQARVSETQAGLSGRLSEGKFRLHLGDAEIARDATEFQAIRRRGTLDVGCYSPFARGCG